MTSRDTYRIDLLKRTQTNVRTDNARPIRRIIETYEIQENTAKKKHKKKSIKDLNQTNHYEKQYRWEWQCGKNFKPYIPTVSNEMEIAYKTGAHEYKYTNLHNNQTYTIKFKQLKQYNDNTKNARNIRRTLKFKPW